MPENGLTPSQFCGYVSQSLAAVQSAEGFQTVSLTAHVQRISVSFHSSEHCWVCYNPDQLLSCNATVGVTALKSIPGMGYVPLDSATCSDSIQDFLDAQKLPEDTELKYIWKSQIQSSRSSKTILHRKNCLGEPKCVAVLSTR